MALLFLLLATYLLAMVAVRHVLASSDMNPLLLALAAAFVGVVWASVLAATLGTLRTTRWAPLVEPLLRPRGLAASGLVAVVLFELLLLDSWPAPSDSTRDPPQEPVPYVMSLARPGVRLERPGDILSHGRATGIISVNSEGFRGPEWPSSEKRPNELRVAVLGGSLVFYGLTDERTIPALLGRALASRLEGTEVVALNAGMISANSTQELVLLETKLIDLRPDVVVVLDGFNDVWNPLYYDGRLGYPPNYIAIQRESSARFEQLLYRLARRSAPVRWLLSRTGFLSRDETPYAARDDPTVLQRLPQEAARLYLANWRKMARLCRAADVDCVFALQPTLLFRREPVAEERRITVPPLEREVVMRFYQLVEAEIGDGAVRPFEGVSALSLSGIFERAADAAFWDTVHVFDEGNELIADRLAEVICQKASSVRASCR